ncbi:reverse transcriptase domain-containing protein [Tanacetum coccineum]
MVTSEGIRANPKKTKAIADMQSPQTLKEMQSLSGKTYTKDTRRYRWTKRRGTSIQEMKQCIMGLPLLTTPVKEEMLYVYLAAATEAVSAVFLTERKGKQCPIHYVSRTLNEAEGNYALMEKLALSLLHMSRILQRYFEAHPIKVITDCTEVILKQGPASGKLANTRTNSEAEYEALLAGLRMAKKMQVRDINAKVDSKLVASQINGSYVASSTSMIKYLATAKECIAGFRSFVIQNQPRKSKLEGAILRNLALMRLSSHQKGVLFKKDIWLLVKKVGPLQANYVYRWRNTWDPAEMHIGARSGGSKGLKAGILRANQSTRTLEVGPKNVTRAKKEGNSSGNKESQYKTKNGAVVYNTKALRPMSFKPGEYVFLRNEASRVEDQGKLGPKWEGPYRVTEAYQNGSYKLQTMEGKEVPRTWHARQP